MTAEYKFPAMASSLPVVGDILGLIQRNYEKIKGRNDSVKALLSGVEYGVKSTTETIAPITLPLIPGLETIDSLACQGLAKMESVMPVITKPTEEIVAETKKYAYSKISGVAPSDEVPDSVTGAVRRRASSVASDVSTSRVGTATVGLVGKALDRTEAALDYYVHKEEPSEKNEEESIGTKMGRMLSKIANKFGKEEKISEDLAEESFLRRLVYAPHHWMSQTYSNLLKQNEEETPRGKIFRFGALFVLGSTLASWGLARATYNKGSELATKVFKFETGANAKKAVGRAIGLTVVAGHKTLQTATKVATHVGKNYSPAFLRRIFEGVSQSWAQARISSFTSTSKRGRRGLKRGHGWIAGGQLHHHKELTEDVSVAIVNEWKQHHKGVPPQESQYSEEALIEAAVAEGTIPKTPSPTKSEDAGKKEKERSSPGEASAGKTNLPSSSKPTTAPKPKRL